MRRLVAMGLFGIIAGLLASCGNPSEEALAQLEQHPLANPAVTVLEGDRSSSSGDVSTGVFNGSTNVVRVSTIWRHDDSPEQRDQIVDEIRAHAESVGCEVSLFSAEEGLPNGHYLIDCPNEDPPVRIDLFVTPSSTRLTLEAFV